MSKPTHSAKLVGSADKSAMPTPVDAPPDKATTVLINFLDTIFKEGAHNWTPEEREKRVDACIEEITDIRKTENAVDMEDFSRSLRARIMTGEFDTTLSSSTRTLHSSEPPTRPHSDVKQAIKQLTDSIEFD